MSSAHDRVQYKQGISNGAYWEKQVYDWNKLDTTVSYNILEKHAQISGLSFRYPWIVATPDFIFKVGYKTEIFYAGIEVKSTASYATYQRVPKEFVMQLQTALEVFNIKQGFLIMLYVDNINKKLIEHKVIPVMPASEFENQELVISVYSHYLKKCIHETLGCDVELNYLCQSLTPLVNNQNLVSCWKNAITALPIEDKCKHKHLLRANKRLLLRREEGCTKLEGDCSVRGYSYRDQDNIYKR